jgi:hypothetical protein
VGVQVKLERQMEREKGKSGKMEKTPDKKESPEKCAFRNSIKHGDGCT